ncbi:MAG TPA: hypothetical protein VM077_03580 [Candidatus Limnocylindrales bacterium]|nr:hypothetical protein [Candidatus Limnocylindrales bacterium]
MSTSNIDDLPWEDIKEISQKGLFKEVFKRIPKSSFQFAAESKNRKALIKSALKSLKKTDPNATYEQATVLADLMQVFAKKVFEENEKTE